MTEIPTALPGPTREIVYLGVPAHRYDIEFMILDGERITITYGGTSTTYDLTTHEWLGTVASGVGPYASHPKFTASRLGSDDLMRIDQESRRAVYGDDG